MRWLSLVLVVLSLALVGEARSAPRSSGDIGGRRVALVVGNGAYRSVDRLANPAHDAKLMADTLRGLGFDLVGGGPLLDLDRAQLAQAVQDFGHALAGAEVGLFYYSGHGLQVQGVNWLVPVDANPTRPQDLDFQMVDADLVLRQMDGAGTRLNLVLLDACRNNPFAVRGLRAVQSGLAEMRAPEGTLISYATQPGNVAADGVGANSPYTTALAETMQRPGMDIFRVFNQVGLQVKRSTGGSQQPWVSTSPIDGDFFFVRAPVPAADPLPAQTQVAGLVRPPPPVSAAPPGPDPQDQLRALVRARRCSILEVSGTGLQPVLRGVALGGGDWTAFMREIGTTRGIRVVRPEVEFVQPFACRVVDTLAPLVRATRDIPGPRLVNLRRIDVAVGEDASVLLRGPPGAAVRVDLYLPDGQVEHVGGPARLGPGGELAVTLARLSAPPGPRLLTVVTSAAALDLGTRPAREAAELYLSVMAQAVAGGAEMRADLVTLTVTAPVPVAPTIRPAASTPPRPARCSAILERAQLGEPPSEADRGFLQSQCR